MRGRVTLESIERVLAFWRDGADSLQWDCLFTTPLWMRLWWEAFQPPPHPSLPAVWRNDELIGIAPMVFTGNQAAFIGNSDVCDYLDFAAHPEHTGEFLEILLEYLREQGVKTLFMAPVRCDAQAPALLREIARREGLAFSCQEEDVSLEMQLPGTWDEFLLGLSGRERHETRRKFRRLHEAGQVNFRVVERPDEVRDEMETFLHLFKLSRQDKSRFMSEQMTFFFRSQAREMAAWSLLKLMFLDIDGHPAASVMCFDYRGSLLLYNNGYDPRFLPLSVGLMSKVLSVRYAIEQGKRKYEFLKGSEKYKFRLGGKPVHIYRCTMNLS